MKKLSTVDQQRIDVLVRSVKERLETTEESFLDVGEILAQLRQELDADQKEFGEFCQDRFGFGWERAKQLIREWERFQKSGTAVPTERHGRELAGVPPELQKAVLDALGPNASADDVKEFVGRLKNEGLAGAGAVAAIREEKVKRSEENAKKRAKAARAKTEEDREGERIDWQERQARKVLSLVAQATAEKVMGKLEGLVDTDTVRTRWTNIEDETNKLLHALEETRAA